MIDNPSFGGYEDLAEGEIRLLRVKDGRSLTFEFQKSLIDDKQPYFALSYTWGEPGLYHSIIVNGLPFHIRRNLYDFVSTWMFKMKTDSLIWIDAISINQECKLEKNAQVLLVDSIYRHATCVLCWLGKATMNSASAFDRMKQIADRFASLLSSRNSNISALSIINKHEDALLKANSNEPNSSVAWQGLLEILHCEYFCRTWIVQETAHVNTEKVLLCGDLHIEWDALGILDYVLWAKAVSNQLDLPWTYTTMRAGVFFHIRERLKNSHRTTLLDLLYSTQSLRCKYPQDKVYAIRSLAHDLGQRNILPDYRESKTLQDVYKDVVNFYIAHPIEDQPLKFLGYASNRHHGPDVEGSEVIMPSWVPDWRYEMKSFPFPNVYNPCPGRRAVFFTEEDCFLVEGLKLDAIKDISTVCSSEMIKNIELDPEWLRIWGQYCIERAEKTSPDILDRVVVADAFRHVEAKRGYKIDWTFAQLARERPGQSYDRSYSSARSFIHACQGRRLVTTYEGYIGLAPSDCQPNDTVCIFFGGQVLYILRSLDQDRYQYIGESFFYGLMDGEGLSLLKPMALSQKLFCVV